MSLRPEGQRTRAERPAAQALGRRCWCRVRVLKFMAYSIRFDGKFLRKESTKSARGMGLPPCSSEPVRESLDYAVRPTQQLRRLQSREQAACSYPRIASSWRMAAKAPPKSTKSAPQHKQYRPGKNQEVAAKAVNTDARGSD